MSDNIIAIILMAFYFQILMKGEKHMKVKNLNGTSDAKLPTGCGSWKEFYTQRRSWPNSCACLTCSNTAEVGAHVKKVGTSDNSWYMVPLCRYHNNQFGEELEVVGNWLEPIKK